MTSIHDIEEEIVEEFDLFDDPMDKYEYLIDIGNKMPPLDEAYKIDENLVKGCQSKVWLVAKEDNGVIEFAADSNTVITKGIIALLIRVLSGQKAEDIIHNELDFINKIDLKAHLSTQRSNGLLAMIGKMKNYARQFGQQ